MTVLGSFDWSQHLCFRSHGLEATSEQCKPGLWHRQAAALPTHFIHPCWRPVYHSHSAMPRSEITFWKELYTPEQHREHTRIRRYGVSIPHNRDSFLLSWSLSSFCQWAHAIVNHCHGDFKRHSGRRFHLLLTTATSDLVVQG